MARMLLLALPTGMLASWPKRTSTTQCNNTFEPCPELLNTFQRSPDHQAELRNRSARQDGAGPGAAFAADLRACAEQNLWCSLNFKLYCVHGNLTIVRLYSEQK